MTPGDPPAPETGLPDALRAAVKRTLDLAGRSARAGSAALGSERRGELLDELAKRGREARDELASRLEMLEKRLGSIEDLLREQDQSKGKPKD